MIVFVLAHYQPGEEECEHESDDYEGHRDVIGMALRPALRKGVRNEHYEHQAHHEPGTHRKDAVHMLLVTREIKGDLLEQHGHQEYDECEHAYADQSVHNPTYFQTI